jgi:EAL domain-containing protein (putative c-di-GMP-specific phosphodiesterase class I)
MSENIRDLSNGEVLFAEGDPADCAYIIESGELEISTHSENEKVIICSLGAGDIVGEMGVIDRAARTATAAAVGHTRLMVVTRNQLTERISQADPILKLLVKILLDRYRSGLNSIKGEVRSGDSDELLSEELVGEYIRHGIDKIRLESELKEALATEQLRVYFQPLLDVSSRRVAGFEALTRWIHPDRGFISPALFITLAEETSLIVPVGLYIFEQACQGLVKFEKIARENNYPFPLFMSINVSGRQIEDPDFMPKAAEITSRLGIPREQIKLEITESLAVDFESTSRWIEVAHDLGFKVSMDDFGTGFSSLETLYKLDLDTAKVDRAFVLHLHDEPRSRGLLRGIVSLMKDLGLEVIVEGIEHQFMLEFIGALDCHYAQGFLIGKSLPLDEAEQLLKDSPDFTCPSA